MNDEKEIQVVDPNSNKVLLDLKNAETLDLTNLSCEQRSEI